ncbi:hypothetical protein ACP0FZ_31805, partial [Escherichia coli]|uniref:hypothetical protein n=1 Tax=Escherichia coli TaxID=562 RepID=UPI003CE8573D
CWAIQANHAYIYIRGEYKFFIDRLNEAIQEAYKAKIIGDKIMDKYDFKVKYSKSIRCRYFLQSINSEIFR